MYNYKYTRIIANAFKKIGMDYIFEDRMRDSETEYIKFRIPVNSNEVKSFEAEYCCIADDIVLFQVNNIVFFPECKKTAALKLCNDLNDTIPYIKFVVEQNNSISLKVDIPIDMSDEAVELIVLFVPRYVRDVLNREYEERIKKAIEFNIDKYINGKLDIRKIEPDNIDTLTFFIKV